MSDELERYGAYTARELRDLLPDLYPRPCRDIIRDLLDAVERRPGADESAPLWPPLNAGMRAVLTNESCVYGSGEAIYRALAEAAGRVVAADERPNPLQASVEAIKFALESDEGFEWLALWNEGSFDTCRKEWPEAPESCYIGADPSLPAHVASKEAVTLSDEERDAARYRELCESRPTLLLTGFFGNGCINRTIEEVHSTIDFAIAQRDASKAD